MHMTNKPSIVAICYIIHVALETSVYRDTFTVLEYFYSVSYKQVKEMKYSYLCYDF